MKRLIQPLLAAAFFCAVSTAPAADEVASIAAVVNGEVITTTERDSAVQTQIRLLVLENPNMTQEEANSKMAELKQKALDDLIDRKLIIASFKEKGGTIRAQYIDQAIDRFVEQRFDGNKEDFMAELKSSGLTFPQFRSIQEEQIIIQALRSQNSGPKEIINTPRERQEYYNENKGVFEEEAYVKLRMISIPMQSNDGPSSEPAQKQLVEEIRRQLVEGADFATMAQTYSQDSFASDGGSVGTIGSGTLNKTLTEIAFGLKPRQVSEIIEDGTYYRLLYVDARQGGKAQPFAEVESVIDKLLKQEKRKQAVDQWLNKLRQDANIKVFGETQASSISQR